MIPLNSNFRITILLRGYFLLMENYKKYTFLTFSEVLSDKKLQLIHDKIYFPRRYVYTFFPLEKNLFFPLHFKDNFISKNDYLLAYQKFLCPFPTSLIFNA